jgi:hypothetical protein
VRFRSAEHLRRILFGNVGLPQRRRRLFAICKHDVLASRRQPLGFPEQVQTLQDVEEHGVANLERDRSVRYAIVASHDRLLIGAEVAMRGDPDPEALPPQIVVSTRPARRPVLPNSLYEQASAYTI